MYASQTTGTVTIESPQGQVVVTIQKLPWKIQRKASDTEYERALDRASRLASAQSNKSLAAMLGARRAQREAAAAAQAGPSTDVDPPAVDLDLLREQRYAKYDKDTVLRGGVQSWTDKKALPAGLDDLDHEASETLHRAILDLTLPAIDAATRETERKNV